MGMIVYGTRVFTKFKGYFGQREECPVCHKVYKKGYVRISEWAHLDYIPLFPIKKRYFRMCPVCGRGNELKSKEAKQEMIDMNGMSSQNLQLFAKHILADKSKGILSIDSSYEVWVKDLFTGEEICIATKLTKDDVKDIKKGRGVKKLEILDV